MAMLLRQRNLDCESVTPQNPGFFQGLFSVGVLKGPARKLGLLGSGCILQGRQTPSVPHGVLAPSNSSIIHHPLPIIHASSRCGPYLPTSKDTPCFLPSPPQHTVSIFDKKALVCHCPTPRPRGRTRWSHLRELLENRPVHACFRRHRATNMQALDPEMRHGRFPLALLSTSEAHGLAPCWNSWKNSSHNSRRPSPRHLAPPKLRIPIPLSVARNYTSNQHALRQSLCRTPQHAMPSAAGLARTTPNNCFRALRLEQAILIRRAASRWKQLCPTVPVISRAHERPRPASKIQMAIESCST
jgi:hypothetical protein